MFDKWWAIEKEIDHWVFVAVLLACGVKMILDPEGFATLPYELANALLDQSSDSRVVLSPAAKIGMRCGGVGAIALAMAIVAAS